MKSLILLVLTSGIILFGCSHTGKINDKINYEGHPIIGAWSFDLDGCIETYEFLPDGTRNVTSNLEIVEAAYTISSNPSDSGFYKIIDEVIKDNGKTDCSGSDKDMTGDIVELYIAFSPNKDQIVFCMDESFDRCFGPFQKNEAKPCRSVYEDFRRT